MKITKKLEKEVLEVLDDYWSSYLNGDLETWASYLPDDYRNIGTTKVEIWNSKKEIIDFTEKVLDQTAGMAQIRDKKSQIIPYEPYVMVHERGDIYVKADEGWIYYAEVRLSSLLEKTTDGWKILHQHGSYPDSKTDEGEAFGFDELRIENKKLKDAIQRRTIELERKNRDLEIETAVEKVRAEAMAMQSTDDFEKVTKQLLKQIQNLNIEGFTGASIGFIDDNHYMSWWDFSSPGNFTNPKSQISHYDAKKFKLLGKEVLDAWLEGDDYHVFYYDLDRLKAAILEWERINMDIANAFRQSITEGKLTQQWNPWGRLSDGLLAFDMIRPPDEEVRKITIKMTQAFEQAYIRFQDLKKAEAQAREARIEAALETIRSRSLAVTKSGEFNDVVKVVFEKLGELGISIDSVLIALNKKGTKDLDVYGCGSSEAGISILNFLLPFFPNPFIDDAFEAQKNSTTGFYNKIYSEEEKNQYYDFALKNTELKNLPPDIKQRIQDSKSYALSVAYTENSMVMLNDMSGQILNDHDADIIKRFSRVFEQAYVRFLDLQKAEAQAREAQIEAALERTRTQSMMMSHSDELNKTSEVFHEQLCRLGIEAEFSYLWLPDEENGEHLFWATWREEKNGQTIFNNKQVVYPLDKTEPAIAECYIAWESGLPVHINPVKPEGIKEYFDTWQELLEGVEKFKPENYPDGLYYIDAYMKYGCFGIMVKDAISEDDERVLARFSKEFERTYTRFLDLQKAEAQAREAQIEAALEKVRSRSLAMHQSEELGEVITTVVKQLKALNFSVDDGVALITHLEGSKDLIEWMENPGFPSAIKFMLPYFDHPVLSDLWEAKEKGKPVLAARYTPEENKSFLNHIYEYTDFKHTPQEVKEQSMAADTYGYTIAFQKHTAIFINDYSGYSLVEDEIDILLRFSRVFEQAYIRFLDLQKAEAQAREAKIEASLEKIRSRTMGMNNSEELLDVINIVSHEMRNLGIRFNHVSFGINDIKQDFIFWTAIGDRRKPIEINVPATDSPIHKNIRKAQKSGIEFFTDNLSAEVNDSWTDHLQKHTKNSFLSKEEIEYIKGKEVNRSIVLLPTIFLVLAKYSSSPFSEEDNQILKRVATVFEQTYTRFLDLQKAEAQAKEAQIEAALEKVRSRTMAMHKAEELKEVVTLVVEKLKDLGVILDANGAILCTYFADSKDVLHWAASSDFSFAGSYLLPYFDHPIFRAAWESRMRRDEYFSESFTVEEKNSFYEHAFEHSDYKYFPDEFKEWILQNDKHSLSFAWSENSAILIPSHTGVVPEGDDIEILKRFAKVFEGAYVRFMDLQKTELAARETQIELSLEKIRSLVTSMRESSELLDIVVAMRNEFVSLGHEAHYFWYMRWLPDIYEKAMTSGDGTKIGNVLSLPRKIHGELKNIADWEKGTDPTVIHVMNPEEAIDYVHKMIEWGDFLQIDQNVPTDDDLRHIGGLTYVMARTSQGEIGYSLPGMVPDPPKEAVDTLVRYAGVFDLAYTRFEDLKEAEEKKREAEIELALEKVRTRTMEMEHSNELPEAANFLFLQIQGLGIPAWSAGYCIWDNEEKSSATAFMSSEGVLQKPFSLPTKGVGYNFSTPLQNGESFHVEELGGEEIVKHYEFMRTLPVFGEVIDGIIEAGFPLPTFQIFHIVYFPHGYLMFITYEAVPHAYDIFKRFAKVFEQTYTRFLDLQTKEEQSMKLLEEKERLEKTLSELKAAQNQLIHAEKMASLGELTAGIAHEIQNPLNFVNNFSEVSTEILDEMAEELEAGDVEEVKAILADLKGNLGKITHHGHRASGIVKSMLDHSRTSSGEKVETDINALCDEYLRLAYHGMRAKDRSFNADFKLDLDSDLPKIKVIPQDIGRVLLNLINNAFQAVADLQGFENLEGPGPKVEVTTKNLDGKIEVSVSDNGPGIPDEIKEKVFQPFFTTKPTGEGTGLGLSLSYDIIKSHGGKIEVESEEGNGTKFTILLPIV